MGYDPRSVFRARSNGSGFRTIAPAVALLFAIQSLKAQAPSCCRGVSGEVRPKPSAIRRALLFGPTFRAICPLAGLQFTIQLLTSQARGGLSSVSDKVRPEPSAIW